ncbi:hypothetical protein BH20ACT2_BH20ACT2_14700 [soil metagenome]
MSFQVSTPGELAYLYLGTTDVAADLAWYNEVLGAELLWRFSAYGADVAGLNIGPGPTVVLADHRPAPSCLPIWEVAELESVVEWLQATGWSHCADRVELPDGPCLVLTDHSGNQLGLLRRDRPDALAGGGR